MDKINHLYQCIQPLADYNSHSRVHLLKTYSNMTCACYVKREDELSFSISGSKLRKYLSLIPYLRSNKIKAVIIIGSAYSNNVVSLSQLLIENAIKPILFLLGQPSDTCTGNLLFTSLLIPKEEIHWISRTDWPKVIAIAEKYRQENNDVIIIPEGACMTAALPGAITLALDILHNEKELDKEFSHIFLDAGTGLTAIATILAFNWLSKSTHLHILLLADDGNAFLHKLKKFKADFEVLVNAKLNWEQLIANFTLYPPTIAKSFGSTNHEVFKKIVEIAQSEGFFLDPIYSAKLFIEGKKIIATNQLSGNLLIVHSGGGLSLMGFQAQFMKHIFVRDNFS